MKKLIMGLVIGLTIGMSTNAFAAVGDSVTAVFAQFNFVVNGEAKGLDSPALVYEGTTYLRTTDLANMLGNDVTYKADSRTIAFNDSSPEPSATPAPSPAPSGEPTPTAAPVPSGEPSPTPTEGASPSPSASPSPEPSASPTPTPDNTAACQKIRDDYAGQIAMVPYGGGSTGQQRMAIHLLEYNRDQALSAAGCQ